MNPTSRAATRRSPERERLTALAAAVLALLLAALAVGGYELVPAVDPDDAPRWIVGVFGDGLGLSPGLYLGLLYTSIVVWAVFCWLLGGRELRAIWILIGTLVALFTLAPPLLSLDVFSYISYARLGTEGLDPYENAPALLVGDGAAERVEDFRFAASIYGPLFTLGSYPIGLVGDGAALWSFKLLAGASVIAIAVLAARIARARGIAGTPVAAFVALNPLTLVHVVGGAHNDGLMVALALLGAFWLGGGRPVAAGAALVASAAVKGASALYVPFALIGAGDRRRLLLGLLAAALAAAAVTLAAFGTSALEALGLAGDNQETVSRWSVPATLARITGKDVDLVRLCAAIAYVPFLVGLMVWAGRGADWIRAAGWATLGLLSVTAWMVPWYVIWVLPFAALSRDRLLIAGAVALTLFQAINAIPV